MKLWSNDFEPGQSIPARFTCDGQDVSPHLAWSGLPEGTESLALICRDPDAPIGDWIHWLVHDIPPGASSIPTGGPLPAGAKEVDNDFGYSRYGGPCPPSGRHRYFFILYALKEKSLAGLTKKNFKKRMEESSLASAELMGTYAR
jgi:Raf kinase inhibitor-like YbhB/YbcL family protein